MKITCNETTGEISGCALDSIDLSGSITVPDNIEVFQNIGKYLYLNGAFSIKPYLMAVPQQESAVVNTNVTVDVSARTPAGELDTSVSGSAALFELGATESMSSFEITNGVGTVVLTAGLPRTVMFRVDMISKYGAVGKVTFTA